MPTVTFAAKLVADIKAGSWTFQAPEDVGRRAFPTDIGADGLDSDIYWASLLPAGDARRAFPGIDGLTPRHAIERFGGDLFGAFAASGSDASDTENSRPLEWDEVAWVAKSMGQGGVAWIPGVRAMMPGATLKLPVTLKGERMLTSGFRMPSTHLVHFNPAVGDRMSLLNQAIMMSAARRMKLPAVRTTLRRDPWLLVSARFDRGMTAHGQVLRRQALTAAQLLAMAGEVDRDLPAIFKLINRVSSRPAADKLQLLRQLIFNQLCGVHDFHAGSVAFLLTADSIEMAPAQGIYSGAARTGALTIGGCASFEWLRADHWIRVAHDAGITPGLIFTEIRQMASKLEPCLVEAAREHCRGRMELEYAAGLVSLARGRVVRCADFVMLAEHQKVPRIRGKKRPQPADQTPAPRAQDEGPDIEPIYE